MERRAEQVVSLDVRALGVRHVNGWLHRDAASDGVRRVEILNPDGAHNLAVGMDADVDVEIHGHAGYFVAGMNKQARVTVHGSVGCGVAENIMSGTVRVRGDASQCAAASGRGGLVVIEGDAAARCGISMKGCDIVVGGDVGHASAFMAQAGTLVVCGAAGRGLGDSLYEATIYVRGPIEALGADAREEPMTAADVARVETLLGRAGFPHAGTEFKRVASARGLYHWHADMGHGAY
jgi:methylamine---glutamate N-methyltransferase subunit B